MEGVERLRLDGLRRDRMVNEALCIWSQTKGMDGARDLIFALRPLCDASTNLYHTDMAAASPRGYRLNVVNDAFDLRFARSYAFGEYPDQRYVEKFILPSYAALNDEYSPSFHRVRTVIQGRYAVYERLMLPYLGGVAEKRSCLTLSRLLLLVEDVPRPEAVKLSQRERQCLHLLMAGKSAKAIAADLDLAQKTVENCVGRLKVKLGASNVTQAVAKGWFLRAQHRRADESCKFASPVVGLSPRERQCLGLAASGRSGREIADELKLSPKTVEKHLDLLKRKLGARNAAELTVRGLTALSGQSETHAKEPSTL